jgi:type IV pilus assembly protein PilE
MEVAGWMERNYTATGSYSVDPAGTGVTNTSFTDAAGSLYSLRVTTNYTIRFSNADGSALANPTATAFTVRAAPTTTDAECGTLTLNQQGVQTESGTGTVADCWQR